MMCILINKFIKYFYEQVFYKIYWLVKCEIAKNYLWFGFGYKEVKKYVEIFSTKSYKKHLQHYDDYDTWFAFLCLRAL